MVYQVQKDYEWFAEPTGDKAHANKVIARKLRQEVDNPESLYADRLCADGKRHDLWGCSQEEARDLWKGKDSTSISIQIWNKEGDGKIRNCTHLFRRKLKSIPGLAGKIKQKATK